MQLDMNVGLKAMRDANQMNDGLFAVVGQRHLVEMTAYFARPGSEEAVYYIRVSEPWADQPIYNSSETGLDGECEGKSLYEVCGKLISEEVWDSRDEAFAKYNLLISGFSSF